MIRSIFLMYRPAFAKIVAYMLQATEYNVGSYLRWLWRARDFKKVTYRKSLVMTRPAKMLIGIFLLGYMALIAVAVGLLINGLSVHNSTEFSAGLILLFAFPIILAHLITLPLILGDTFIIKPLHGLKIRHSSMVFAKHTGVRLAIAGSYGKTTMKEILLTVLSEGKKVAATPANRNVAISHAQFSKSISGDEDVVIIEYGEGKPGDVMKFAKKTHPNAGIITGLAPAHLDKYKTLSRAGKDIFSLAKYLEDKEVYVNADSAKSQPFIKAKHTLYSADGVADWSVKDIKQTINGLSFSLVNKGLDVKVKSRLLGRHLIGPLALAVYLGLKYGLTPKQIETGVAKIEPFEHRMKPYQLSGAWIIDDTYNGNIEGMKAGLALLKELPAKSKIYVTPGLVDQGRESSKIHEELGEAITLANPDKVILINHSVTGDIIKGMNNYKGELIVEDDPLDFYTNLDKIVAAGDLVLLQNDWPDNYN